VDNDLVDAILLRRGVLPAEKESFMNPTLRELMPDPLCLAGMEAAAKITAAAVRAKNKIAIFGDYDVDGITSVAILAKYFRQIGVDIIWHLPDREQEGYGLNADAVREFAAADAKLLITVDCGIGACAEVALAKELGMSVVITDHHEPTLNCPAADAIVNPKQSVCGSGLNYLAGVGVAFMFLIALNRELGHPVADLLQFLDLVALGTICDTMPLIGLNRAFAAAGLRVLAQQKNTGLRALANIAGIKKFDAYTAGFVLGPRLNAAGRITDANIALDLILTDNIILADDLAKKIDDMNAQRQAIQNKIMTDADEMARAQSDSGAFALWVAGDEWHGGVMGIVAGRLKEKHNLPCCVATKNGGVISGSGRSIGEVDLGKIITDAVAAGILTAGGGHKAAAGFELSAENSDRFGAFLNEAVAAQLDGARPTAVLDIDLEMDAGGADWDLAENLARMAPFGIGNPEPILCLSGGLWTFCKTMGTGAHITGTLKTSRGTLPCVGFNMTDSEIGRFLLNEANFGARIRVVGKLKENEYMGRQNVQLFLEDIAIN
jgi:single-stranded-DNA-specific exonuclease